MIVTVAFLIVAAACSLFSKDVNVSQELELHVDCSSAAPTQPFVLQEVTTASGILKKYPKEVAALEVESITLAVKELRGGERATVSGNFEFAPAGSTDFKLLSTLPELDLSALATKRESVALEPVSVAVKQELAELLKNGSKLIFRFDGSTGDEPLAATIVVTIAAEMKVKL